MILHNVAPTSGYMLPDQGALPFLHLEFAKTFTRLRESFAVRGVSGKNESGTTSEPCQVAVDIARDIDIATQTMIARDVLSIRAQMTAAMSLESSASSPQSCL